MSLPLAPWTITSDSPRQPWLSTWTALEGGSFLCAALPNLAEPNEREQRVTSAAGVVHARLFEVRATLQPQAGFTLQWISPAATTGLTVRLPAGEAAVFRLVRERPR